MEDLNNQFDVAAYLSSSGAKREQLAQVMFKQHYPLVYRLAYNLCGNEAEAQDIAQEVFIAALKGLAKFRAESQLSTWLYRITTRITGRHLARRARHPWVDAPVDHIADSARADADIVTKELVQAIAKLSLPLRTVLSLVAIEGLSHQVAADVLDVPVGTIWSRLHSARKQLAANLK